MTLLKISDLQHLGWAYHKRAYWYDMAVVVPDENDIKPTAMTISNILSRTPHISSVQSDTEVFSHLLLFSFVSPILGAKIGGYAKLQFYAQNKLVEAPEWASEGYQFIVVDDCDYDATRQEMDERVRLGLSMGYQGIDMDVVHFAKHLYHPNKKVDILEKFLNSFMSEE